MDRQPVRTYEQELEQLEQRIQDSQMPRGSMSKEIMYKLGERTMTRQRTKSKIVKRTVIAASVAAVLGTGVVGAGFVSPTMASALKQIPGIGAVFYGLNADEIQRAVDQGILTQPLEQVTKDGVTLTLTNVLYDGTRLSFSIEREGEIFPENAASPYIPMDAKMEGGDDEWITSRKIPEEKQEKGYIKSPEILINGQKVTLFGSFGDDPSNLNAVFAEYTEVDSLPNEFELTVRTEVTRVDGAYEFKVPVKLDQSKLTVQPNETKSSGDFSYTVKKLESTATSTRLVLDSKGEVPASPEQTGEYAPTMMYYEIVDDQGKVLEQRRLGFFHSKSLTEYHVDELYAAISPNAKSVTIKPFTFTMKPADWSVVGEKLDDNGKIISNGDRTYIKELEMNVPLER